MIYYFRFGSGEIKPYGYIAYIKRNKFRFDVGYKIEKCTKDDLNVKIGQYIINAFTGDWKAL